MQRRCFDAITPANPRRCAAALPDAAIQQKSQPPITKKPRERWETLRGSSLDSHSATLKPLAKADHRTDTHMIAKSVRKINGGPAGIDTNLLYRAADLAAQYEVEQELAELVETFLMTPRSSGERPGGFRIGKHVVVYPNVWIQSYGIVVANLEKSSGEGQGR